MFRSNPYYGLNPIDSDINTWNMNWNSNQFNSLLSEKSYKEAGIPAILIVHNLGNIINVPKLKLKFPGIVVVEDNCEGFLGSYNNKPSGTASLAYSISFFGNKTFTSGEGGAFCTNDYELYNEMNRIRAQGITPEKFIFSEVGYNYRMTNVQAALLCGQLELKNEIIERKKSIFNLYREELQHDKIHFQINEDEVENPNWMLGLRFDLDKHQMDKLQLRLHQNDIETRPMFPPINYHSHYKGFGNIFPNSKTLYETVLILPSYPELSITEVKYISKTIKDFLK